MKINIKENKTFLIYLAVSVTLSGLIGFYGGRYYEKANFNKRISNIPTTGIRDGRSLRKPSGARGTLQK